MKDIFKRTTNSIICSNIIALIIGLFMTFSPDTSLKTIGTILAIYIIIEGIALIILDITSNNLFVPIEGIASGIISIVLGAVLLSNPNIITTLFTLIVGIWIALSSVNTIKIALSLKKENTPWVSVLLLGIIDLVIGLLVIFNPFEAAKSITFIVGIMVIIQSIVNIITMLVVKHDVKKIKKEVKKQLEEK